MQGEERNQGSQINNNEEWETGYPGDLPFMWYQDIQDRQGINSYGGQWDRCRQRE
jgi:hypothetical protein